jgi:hypothetical protein
MVAFAREVRPCDDLKEGERYQDAMFNQWGTVGVFGYHHQALGKGKGVAKQITPCDIQYRKPKNEMCVA